MVCASGGHRSSNELVWDWSYAQIAFPGPHGVASHDCLTDTFPGDKMSDRDPSLANLPSEPEITRRDFVGGTLVGTGAALLAMASPDAVRTAQAQTVPSKMTGLGPDW